MIKINNLTKKFDKNIILDNINLDIANNETIAVIGPSGCGKSTLLRLIIGLDRADRGEINLNGKNISLLGEDKLVNIRKNISMVFQSSALFDSLTVGENVAFAIREHTKKPESEIKEIVKSKLSMVDLDGTQSLMPSELSGGMQKRISLARAIALDPKIILYDEPTTGLDPITSTVIEDLINKLAKQLNVTSIIVTHQLSTIFRCATRIVMLNNGKFIECGNVSAAKDSKDPIVHNFLYAGVCDKIATR